MDRSLLKTVRQWDSVLVMLAALNGLHVWWLVITDSGGYEFGSPWYIGGAALLPVWLMAPTRLLVAASCIRTRRWWAELVAALIAGQLAITGYVNTLAPDEYNAERFSSSFFDSAAAQALFAAILLVTALRRGLVRLRPGIARSSLVVLAVSVGVMLIAGYASNVVTQAAAEREVAKFVYADIMRSRPFDASNPRAFERFREAGLPVRVTNAFVPQRPEASVGPTGFLGPFVLSVRYDYYNGREDNLAGEALVVGLFGKAVLMRRDADAWSFRLRWYFLPY